MNHCASRLNTISLKAREVMSAPFRMLMAAFTALMTSAMLAAPTLCSTTIKSNIDMDTLFGNMANIIIKIAFYVGAIVAISGIFQLVLAYKDDNSDSQTRAVRLIVVGAVLIGFRTILQIAGII